MNEASSFRKDDVLAGARRSLGDCKQSDHSRLSAKPLFCEETRRGTIVHSHQIRYLFSISLMRLVAQSFSAKKLT